MSTVKAAEEVKLTSAERKQIDALIAKAKGADKKEMSAQDTIPYERMYPDGICRVTAKRYSKTIQFQDINYQLSQNEDQDAIFSGWGDFLNYFDPTVCFQLTFVNLATSEENIAHQITIPLVGDVFDSIRTDYTRMLRGLVIKGKNGLYNTISLRLVCGRMVTLWQERR